MEKVGDFKWYQISQWELTPANCISKFVPIGQTGMHAQYLLARVTEVIENGYRFEMCKTDKDVPLVVLFDKGTGYFLNIDHHNEYHEKPA